jgi:hypothetical protein
MQALHMVQKTEINGLADLLRWQSDKPVPAKDNTAFADKWQSLDQ